MNIEGILTNGEKLKEFCQQNRDYEAQTRQNLGATEHTLQQHKRDFQVAIERFGQTTAESLGQVSTLLEQIISELTVWKNKQNHERQKEYTKFRFVCDEMEKLNAKIYEQLQEIELVLRDGAIQTDNSAQLSFAQSCTAEVLRLRQEHLQHFQVLEQWERNHPGVTSSLLGNSSVPGASKKNEFPSVEPNFITERLRNIKMSVLQGREILQIFELMQFNQESLFSSSPVSHREDILEHQLHAAAMDIQQCTAALSYNIIQLSAIQEQIISQLTMWKYEQQQMANEHSVSLDILQCWCEELAQLIWEVYEQLNRLNGFQQWSGAMLAGHSADLKLFTHAHIDQVHKLLQDLLNHSLIVEQQPTRFLFIGGHRLQTPVVVRLLTSKILNVHAPLDLSARIVSEEQLNSPNDTNEPEMNGVETKNGNIMMDRQSDDLGRITFKSRRKSIIRMNIRYPRRRDGESRRIGEMKACFLFKCNVAIGSLTFQIKTVSLPVVWYAHPTQKPKATATILWDNVFGEMDRVPFQVPSTVSWSQVAVRILNAQFLDLTGRGLSEENLACLARKAFRDHQPLPETITWREFCTENLPGKSFTFWQWFYAALMLFKNDSSYLKNLWTRGLIMGFIEKEAVEALLARCEVGTFLLRFSDSVLGAIVIVTVQETGVVHYINPIESQDLLERRQLVMTLIREVEGLRLLYQPSGSIQKDDAFGEFY